MRGHRVVLAALALWGGGMLFAAGPAQAQYYGGGYGPPPGYGYGYGRPAYRPYGRRGGSICVTARGNCPYPPAPFNAPCGCDIPGFGLKRGQIGG